jgi:hypothetical protein
LRSGRLIPVSPKLNYHLYDLGFSRFNQEGKECAGLFLGGPCPKTHHCILTLLSRNDRTNHFFFLFLSLLTSLLREH